MTALFETQQSIFHTDSGCKHNSMEIRLLIQGHTHRKQLRDIIVLNQSKLLDQLNPF